jgi:hypothetical protein
MCHCRRRWHRVWIEFFVAWALIGELLSAGDHAEIEERTYLLYLTNV